MKKLFVILSILISLSGYSQYSYDREVTIIDTLPNDPEVFYDSLSYMFLLDGRVVVYVEEMGEIEYVHDTVYENEIINEFMTLLNVRRKKLGRDPLTYYNELEKASKYHIDYLQRVLDMGEKLSYPHNQSIDVSNFDEVVSPKDRIKYLCNIPWKTPVVNGGKYKKKYGEILIISGYVVGNPKEIALDLFEGFCSSKTHYEMVTSKEYTHIGGSWYEGNVVFNFIGGDHKLSDNTLSFNFIY